MSDFAIDCSPELMEKIEAIAFSEVKVEVGGFLVGTYDEKGAKVTEVLPAKHSVGQSTQLTFTHDTWNALYEDLNAINGTLVGWFHSHPNFGVFLSEHDQFIQQNFFGTNGNITIVVDPIRGRRGWFYSHEGKIKKYQKEEDTTRERLGVSATNSEENIEAIMGTTQGGVTTSKVVLISAIMSLIGTFLGYGLSVATGGSSSQATVDALTNRVQALEIQLALNGTALPESAPSAKPSPKTSKATTAGKSTTSAKPTPTATKNSLTPINAVKGTKCDPTKDKGTVNGLACKKKGNTNTYTWQTVNTGIKPSTSATPSTIGGDTKKTETPTPSPTPTETK